MCAEFQIRVWAEELKRAYRIASPGTFEPQPAYYPNQKIPVIGLMGDDVSRGLNLLRCGWSRRTSRTPNRTASRSTRGPRP